MAEYALLTALISVSAIAISRSLAGALNGVFSSLGTKISDFLP